jgi:hypothetical protein
MALEPLESNACPKAKSWFGKPAEINILNKKVRLIVIFIANESPDSFFIQ